MDKEEKEKLVEIIQQEIEKTTGKIEELKDFTEPVSPDDSIGRISRMDAINNKTIFDASMRNAQNRLSQLHEVLRLKDEADFGKCRTCNRPIPFERLKIRPEIQMCAHCLQKNNEAV